MAKMIKLVKVSNTDPERICQGDIFRNIPFFEDFSVKEGMISVSLVEFPYVLVLTQDCDLLQEHNNLKKNQESRLFDKKIISTLVAPLYNAEHFWAGEHVSELGYKARKINVNKTEGDKIKGNNDPRYHYLSFPTDVQLVDMIIDFKHYFSIPSSYLKDNIANRVCTIAELFREDISHRFAFFLSRIGLP